MNKKTYLIGGLLGFIILTGAACTMPNNSTTNNSVTTNSVPAETTSIACAKKGWQQHELSDVGLSFCYDPAWGTPTIEPSSIGDEAKIGDYYAIKFAGGEEEGFRFWYQTTDFEKTGDRGGALDYCFNCLDVTAAEEDLKTQLYAPGFPEEFYPDMSLTNVSVVPIAGVSAVKLQSEGGNQVFLFPNAPTGYHTGLSGGGTQIAPIVESLQFSVNSAAVTDTNEIEAPAVSEYYVAEKLGTTTTVYKDAYTTGARTEVFNFQEAVAYDRGSDNFSREQRPAVAYDRNTDAFAYASVNGLFLRDNQADETTTLISKTGSSGDIDGSDIPTWSAAEITNVFFLLYPQFSADGQYLSFSGAMYEGGSTFIMNLETKAVVKAAGKDGQGIGGQDVAWSLTGHDLVVGQGIGYGSAGLFSVTNEDFGNATELLSVEDNEFHEVEQAVFVDTDTVAYTYSPISNQPKRLAIINTDGSQQQDLVVDSVDNFVLAANAPQILYFKQDAYTPANTGLWIYDTKDKSNRQAAVEEPEQELIFQSFSSDALVYIVYDTTQGSSTLYSVNPDTLEDPYSAVQPTQNSSLKFLGNEYRLF